MVKLSNLDTFFGHEVALESIGIGMVVEHFFSMLAVYSLIVILVYIVLGSIMPVLFKRALFVIHNVIGCLVLLWGPFLGLLYVLYDDQISVARYLNISLVWALGFLLFTLRNRIFQLNDSVDTTLRTTIEAKR